jgi:hypothetical protein
MSFQYFTQIITEFGEKAYIPDIKISENGHCSFTLELEKEIEIHVHYISESNQVYMYGIPGYLSGENQVSICQTLLDANLFWYKTNNATFALDLKNKIIVLQKTIDCQILTCDLFKNNLESLAATVFTWMNELEKLMNEKTSTHNLLPPDFDQTKFKV